MKLWEMTRYLVVSYVPVRRRSKKLRLKLLLFWSIEYDVMRLTSPFLRYKTVILSIPDLVVRNV